MTREPTDDAAVSAGMSRRAFVGTVGAAGIGATLLGPWRGAGAEVAFLTTPRHAEHARALAIVAGAADVPSRLDCCAPSLLASLGDSARTRRGVLRDLAPGAAWRSPVTGAVVVSVDVALRASVAAHLAGMGKAVFVDPPLVSVPNRAEELALLRASPLLSAGLPERSSGRVAAMIAAARRRAGTPRRAMVYCVVVGAGLASVREDLIAEVDRARRLLGAQGPRRIIAMPAMSVRHGARVMHTTRLVVHHDAGTLEIGLTQVDGPTTRSAEAQLTTLGTTLVGDRGTVDHQRFGALADPASVDPQAQLTHLRSWLGAVERADSGAIMAPPVEVLRTLTIVDALTRASAAGRPFELEPGEI